MHARLTFFSGPSYSFAHKTGSSGWISKKLGSKFIYISQGFWWCHFYPRGCCGKYRTHALNFDNKYARLNVLLTAWNIFLAYTRFCTRFLRVRTFACTFSSSLILQLSNKKSPRSVGALGAPQSSDIWGWVKPIFSSFFLQNPLVPLVHMAAAWKLICHLPDLSCTEQGLMREWPGIPTPNWVTSGETSLECSLVEVVFYSSPAWQSSHPSHKQPCMW